jgi:hypothetical protein
MGDDKFFRRVEPIREGASPELCITPSSETCSMILSFLMSSPANSPSTFSVVILFAGPFSFALIRRNAGSVSQLKIQVSPFVCPNLFFSG